MNGILLVDKPADWTSHDVVAKLRGVLGERRMGHSGTLDPMATGVLVVGFGNATRLLNYIVDHDKTYLATIRLGQRTTTDDADGELLPEDIAESCRKAGILKDAPSARANEAIPDLPIRSPLLCSGCPHRSTFYNLSQMKVPVAGDIGCYNLGTLPPFNAQHTMGAMGASVGVLHGMGLSGLPEPAVCTIGDGTFFHAGVAPLLNMVHNKGKGTVIIMDNRTTAMTGHQDNPGIEATLSLGTVAPVDIAGLCRACGVEKVVTANAFDMKEVRKGLEECTAYDGVSVLITRGDCVFVSRSPKPARVVDADKCIACGKCIQSGCPSVVLSDAVHPKTGKRKARIEPVTCVGCGVCSQICPVQAISGPENA